MSAVDRAAEIIVVDGADLGTGITQADARAAAYALADAGLLVTDKLTAELESLRRWKAEASVVLAEWERVWEAAGRPGPLGKSKARATRDRVITPQVQAVLDAAQHVNATKTDDGGDDLIARLWKLDFAVDAYLASRPS